MILIKEVIDSTDRFIKAIGTNKEQELYILMVNAKENCNNLGLGILGKYNINELALYYRDKYLNKNR
jgi:hypothetical protein